MREIYSFKENIEDLVDKDNMKLWINKKQGRRVECIFKIGNEQFIESDILYEDEKYIIRGQNISKQLGEEIIEKGGFDE